MVSHTFPGQACEGLGKGGEAFDKPSVKVGRSDERLYIAKGCGQFLILDGGDFSWVHLQALD